MKNLFCCRWRLRGRHRHWTLMEKWGKVSNVSIVTARVCKENTATQTCSPQDKHFHRVYQWLWFLFVLILTNRMCTITFQIPLEIHSSQQSIFLNTTLFEKELRSVPGESAKTSFVTGSCGIFYWNIEKRGVLWGLWRQLKTGETFFKSASLNCFSNWPSRCVLCVFVNLTKAKCFIFFLFRNGTFISNKSPKLPPFLVS